MRSSIKSVQTSGCFNVAFCVAIAMVLHVSRSHADPAGTQASAPQKWSALTKPAAPELNGNQEIQASASPIRVVVRSYETAAIGSEINARITRLPQREGDRFKKGDVIVEFDCRKIDAEHDAAAAVLSAHQMAYENQRQMLRYKAGGTLAVNQARHELDKAKAEVRGLEAKLTGCQIKAPFDGRVTEKAAQVHEIAQPNQPLMKIINEGKLELVLMVPSSLLSKVAEGTRFRVQLDENGDRHDARIVQSTGLIDPVSQSARMIAELVGTPSHVVPGMSGTAMFTNSQDAR
jgi:membrane fusion protein, multidrug efflux system